MFDRIKEKASSLKSKLLVGAGTVATGVASLTVIARADEPDALQTAFSTAVNGVKTDFLSYASVAVPAALSIAGVVLAITLGWHLFKKFR